VNRIYRRLLLASVCLLAVFIFSIGALAQNTHDRTHFGSGITIGPDEKVSDATCFACSVHVRGQVSGDVTTFGGSIVVEDGGDIAGDATSFGGDVRIEKDVKVGGGVTVFGGRVHRDPAATIGGDVTNFSGFLWVLLIFVVPIFVIGGFIALIIWVIRRLTRGSVPVSA
jgi:cytoskeletal protein CcmA (bactofilin family)